MADITKTVKCPTKCGGEITVQVDARIGGKQTFCPRCKTMVWVPIVNVPPTAFPKAIDRDGRPWVAQTI